MKYISLIVTGHRKGSKPFSDELHLLGEQTPWLQIQAPPDHVHSGRFLYLLTAVTSPVSWAAAADSGGNVTIRCGSICQVLGTMPGV